MIKNKKKFNLFFFNFKNHRLAINSSSSILVIFLDFNSYKDHAEFMEDLTGKFLDIINQVILKLLIN